MTIPEHDSGRLFFATVPLSHSIFTASLWFKVTPEVTRDQNEPKQTPCKPHYIRVYPFQFESWYSIRIEKSTSIKNRGIIYQDGSESLYGMAGTGIYLANKSESLLNALKGTAFESWTQYSGRAGESVPVTIKLCGRVNRAKFIDIEHLSI